MKIVDFILELKDHEKYIYILHDNYTKQTYIMSFNDLLLDKYHSDMKYKSFDIVRFKRTWYLILEV